MIVTAMGRVNVPAPGTPVPLSSDPNQKVAKLFVQSIPGLSGKGYLGTRNLNRTTLSNVIRILWPNPAGGISDQFIFQSSDGSNSIQLSQYCIDMDVAGEGLLVSYWTV